MGIATSGQTHLAQIEEPDNIRAAGFCADSDGRSRTKSFLKSLHP
ncbi:MAG: hypothetical protein RL215_257 [Planctomycetota bacterium]